MVASRSRGASTGVGSSGHALGLRRGASRATSAWGLGPASGSSRGSGAPQPPPPSPARPRVGPPALPWPSPALSGGGRGWPRGRRYGGSGRGRSSVTAARGSRPPVLDRIAGAASARLPRLAPVAAAQRAPDIRHPCLRPKRHARPGGQDRPIRSGARRCLERYEPETMGCRGACREVTAAAVPGSPRWSGKRFGR